MNDKTFTNITIMLPAGRLPVDILKKVGDLAETYGLSVYLSNLQNLRLINVPAQAEEKIKEELLGYGVRFKGPGQFPIPRICIGKPHCSLGIINTEELSQTILNRFAKKEKTKAKLKIAIAGCSLCCSDSKTSDIGIIAGRNGFEMYAGGKGGSTPRTGRRIRRNIGEEELLETIDRLVEFHDGKTGKKQRMNKLLKDQEFPYLES